MVKITAVAQVQAKLLSLQPRLAGSNFDYFNRAYIVMTDNLVAQINHGAFKQPQLIEKLIVNFADLYFEAVDAWIAKHPAPAPWHGIKYRPFFVPSYAWTLVGARIHIKQDLPVAIAATVTNLPKFRADYLRTNQVMLDCTHQFLNQLAQTYYLARFIQNHPWLYRRFLVSMLNRWRDAAWQKSATITQ